MINLLEEKNVYRGWVANGNFIVLRIKNTHLNTFQHLSTVPRIPCIPVNKFLMLNRDGNTTTIALDKKDKRVLMRPTILLYWIVSREVTNTLARIIHNVYHTREKERERAEERAAKT